MKGVGIVLVVYGHVVRGVQSAGLPVGQKMCSLVDAIIYSFHMPLFFFVSGIFFMQSLGSRGKTGLILNKLDTVVYPYIIWSLLQGGIELVLSRFTSSSVSVYEILALLWAPRAQFWFLYILFLVFVVAVLIYRRPSGMWFWMVFMGTAALNICTPFIPDVFPVRYLCHYLVYFALGVLTREYLPILLRRLNLTTFLFLGVAILLQFMKHGLHFQWVGESLSFAVGVTSVLSVICISAQLAKFSWSRPISLLGATSLHIYLMHILMGSGVRIVLQKFLNITDPWIHIILGTLVATGLPCWLVLQFRFVTGIYLFSPPAVLSLQRWRRQIKTDTGSRH
jgi:fucose 4-O-acetylase-like acetyltransferase